MALVPRAALARSYVFTALFCVEALIKILALGFYWSPGSYLRDPWNGCGRPSPVKAKPLNPLQEGRIPIAKLPVA